MDQSFLSEVESGRHGIALERIYRLADALGVRMSELVADTEPNSPA